jgi:hypothetical protein
MNLSLSVVQFRFLLTINHEVLEALMIMHHVFLLYVLVLYPFFVWTWIYVLSDLDLSSSLKQWKLAIDKCYTSYFNWGVVWKINVWEKTKGSCDVGLRNEVGLFSPAE